MYDTRSNGECLALNILLWSVDRFKKKIRLPGISSK